MALIHWNLFKFVDEFGARTHEKRSEIGYCDHAPSKYFFGCTRRNKNRSYIDLFSGEHGWRSGEKSRLLAMWPGFDSQTQRRMWVEFVCSLVLCSESSSHAQIGLLLGLNLNYSTSIPELFMTLVMMCESEKKNPRNYYILAIQCMHTCPRGCLETINTEFKPNNTPFVLSLIQRSSEGRIGLPSPFTLTKSAWVKNTATYARLFQLGINVEQYHVQVHVALRCNIFAVI